MTTPQQQLDAWIDTHFDEEVKFLQELIRVPTDTPPGNNAPHAERTAELLATMGLTAEKYAVPEAEVKAAGLETITNLIVRRPYGAGGKTTATWCLREKAGPMILMAERSWTAGSTAARLRSASAISQTSPSPSERWSRWACRSTAASNCM
jgi:hypothetical protein